MQKLVYLSNSRDYAEQGNINENKYFIHINALLDQGWKVSHVTQNVVEVDNSQSRLTRKRLWLLCCLKSLMNKNKKRYREKQMFSLGLFENPLVFLKA